MGKKLVPAKKPKGQDISKYFDLKAARTVPHAARLPGQVAGAPPLLVPGDQAGCSKAPVPDTQEESRRVPAKCLSELPTSPAAFQRSAPSEELPSQSASSQDEDDAVRVVWQSSPMAEVLAPKLENEVVPKQPSVTAGVKERLITAAQKAVPESEPATTTPHHACIQTVLQGTLALGPGPHHRAAVDHPACATSTPSARTAQPSALLQAHRGMSSSQIVRSTPLAMCTASAARRGLIGGCSRGKRRWQHGPSTQKRAAGKKRKVLLDLLDQVELLFADRQLHDDEPDGKENDLLVSNIVSSFERASQHIEAASQDADGQNKQTCCSPSLAVMEASCEAGDPELEALMAAAAQPRPRVIAQLPPVHASTSYDEHRLAPAGPLELQAQGEPDAGAGQAVVLEERRRLCHLVLEVVEGTSQKDLRLLNERTGRQVWAHLQDGWQDTPVRSGDAVNLLAEIHEHEDGAHAVCSYNQGLIVLHPDLLLSGTRISSSFRCARQSVLEERFGGSSGVKAAEGTLLHELMQVALMERIVCSTELRKRAQNIVSDSTDKLLEVGLSEAQALACLTAAIPTITAWIRTFLLPEQGQSRPRSDLHISEVVDIEETIWAPKYGLKGMIDASLQVDVTPGCAPDEGEQASWLRSTASRDQKRMPVQAGTAILPLEFKTGKPHQSHKAQVSLYLLLMEERYGATMERGLLWYLGQAAPEVVRSVPAELAALLMQRNLLAAFLQDGRPLPPLLQQPRACASCFQLTACALAHKAVEAGTLDSAGMGVAFEEVIGHMTPGHAHFLATWLRLLELEEAGSATRRAEIWAMSGEEREAAGRCIHGLRLVSQVAGGRPQGGVLLQLERPASHQAPKLTDLGFTVGELTVLSIEGHQAGVARGVVHHISATTIALSLQRPLRTALVSEAHVGPPRRWRVDRDDVSSIFTRMRRNLIGLFDRRHPCAAKLRQVIVDLQAPAGASSSHTATLPPHFTTQLAALSEEQQFAVQRIVARPEYSLVLGMPGTGKTSTIVCAVQALVSCGCSVLLTSYTNSAVDNILLKLIDAKVSFVRLGRPDTVHPAVRPYLVGGEQHPDTSVAGRQRLAATASVVGCTCLGVSSPMLQGKQFDVCIVDEAGQMTLPTVVGPLLLAHSFCLVGDHYQLPPLVASERARAQGLAASLFHRLSEAQPQAVVSLCTQYRMAEDIMTLANVLVYNGQLRCGLRCAATARLHLPIPISLTGAMPEWLQQVVSPDRRVIFLDTDSLDAAEQLIGSAVCNTAEAELIVQVIGALTSHGVGVSAIGAISPYRSQVSLLRRKFEERGWPDLEVLTVDKYQGRDKQVILISLNA
ncbi:hypothetical protein WJX72_008129 [[Myrmecia] bisecta]|uniref:DNA replication ATP-dependent helicase/nuclease n=1 Tax=[Myrmecia] bisecta TaxID=41462 RepID=A0AAW1QRT2_9CHLO